MVLTGRLGGLHGWFASASTYPSSRRKPPRVEDRYARSPWLRLDFRMTTMEGSLAENGQDGVVVKRRCWTRIETEVTGGRKNMLSAFAEERCPRLLYTLAGVQCWNRVYGVAICCNIDHYG